MTVSAKRNYPSSGDRRSDALEPTLTRSFTLNWEVIVYVILFALVVFTRFYALGERAMSHDESLHVYYSYNLYTEGDFQHTPLMHGPILFHMTAFAYSLFGDNDFTGRLYTAVFGVLLVMSPLLFRKWLGRWGAILATTMLLISPLMLYYNRYIRHDTPSILSAILMAWAIFMYVDGPPNQKRKAYWLYLLSGAMLWNLGSKETAFFYIAIFGLFLMLYWFMRMAQQAWKIPAKPLFYSGMVATLLAGTAALGMYVVLDIVPLDRLAANNESLTWYANLIATPGLVSGVLWAIVLFLITAVLIGGTGIVTFVVYQFSRGVGRFAQMPHAGTMVFFVGASIFAMFVISMLEGALNLFPNLEMRSFVLWTMMVGMAITIVVLGSLYWATRGTQAQVPWRTVFLVILVSVIALTAFIVIEERSHISREDLGITEPIEPADPADPNAALDTETVTSTSTFTWMPIGLAWALAFVLIAGLWYSRYAKWWDWLDRFPELDVLIIMGSMVLPWLTAVFIVATRGSPQDYTNIGANLPDFLLTLLPVSGTTQVGQFFVGFMAWLPMMLIAVVTGLTWNWKRYLVSSLIFHALFAFFFTTMFTNARGLATGMIYSLQYWIEQQAERRGNQPQYYYLLIIMPIYEFLPIIGSVLAMISGMVVFWRKRARYAELTAPQKPVDPMTFDAVDPEEKVKAVLDAGISDEVDDDDLERLRTTDSLPESEVQAALEMAKAQAEAASLSQMIDDEGGDIDEVIDDDAVGDARASVVVSQTVPPRTAPLKTKSGEPIDTLNLESLPTERDKARYLTHVPFLLFVSFWAILNLVAYTLAGEKMPWLGTHMTTPLIFLTAWYFGGIFDRVNFIMFLRRGWMVLIFAPLLFVAGFQVIAPFFGGRPPFSGVTAEQLGWTYSWLAAVAVTGGLVYSLIWVSRRLHIEFPERARRANHVWKMIGVSVFAVLAILSFRAAWMASFINHDYATEYLVYAHATPGTKIVINQLKDLSQRTTDGMDILFAYDSKMSWPGVWYFREFNNARFMGDTATLQQMEDASVVLVGESNRGVVEPLLEGRYQRFDYKRMWWPMMDYFDLTPSRVVNAFDLSPENQQSGGIRRGMFDIWWNRDYTQYGNATGKDFTVTNWPVAENMYMYVRKDFAAQVWPYGIGEGTVGAGVVEEVSACVANWQEIPALVSFNTAGLDMRVPIGIDVHDGRVYVAEDANHRVSVFDSEGNFIETFGERGIPSQEGAFFERPNSVAVADDGTIYVVDTWNYRVRGFDQNYNPVALWGSPLTVGINAPVQPFDGFWGPRDAAIDAEGNVYVSDTGNKRVRVYDAQGNYLRDIGVGGSAPGQLDEPSGLAIADGKLYVADTWNRRVSIFALDGTFLETIPLRAWYEELGNRPYIAVDEANDYLYITDPDGGRVLVYDSVTNECVGAFGQLQRENPNLAQFSTVGGIAVDDEGFVYVVDMAAGRVLKFQSFPRPIPEMADDNPSDFVEPIIEDLNNAAGVDGEGGEQLPETTEEVGE